MQGELAGAGGGSGYDGGKGDSGLRQEGRKKMILKYPSHILL